MSKLALFHAGEKGTSPAPRAPPRATSPSVPRPHVGSAEKNNLRGSSNAGYFPHSARFGTDETKIFPAPPSLTRRRRR